MPVRSLVFAAIVSANAMAFGQNLAFEVASVKPAALEPRRGIVRPGPDRFYVPGTPLRALIRNAYGLSDFQLLGGPAWIGTELWEVSAKAERVPAAGEMRLMLQRLLEERFALRTHRETRDRYFDVAARAQPSDPHQPYRHRQDRPAGTL